MAANNYKVNPSQALSPNLAASLLNTLENINQSFAVLQLLRAAMLAQKDGTAGNATDWVTMSKMFGVVDSSSVLSSTVALAMFTEIDSFVTNGGPSLQQCCARLKQ